MSNEVVTKAETVAVSLLGKVKSFFLAHPKGLVATIAVIVGFILGKIF